MATIPAEIGQSLTSGNSNLGDIFQNIEKAIGTVTSVYDQITGKAEGVEGQMEYVADEPAKVEPAVTTKPTSYVPYMAIGAIVLVGMVLVLRN